MAAVGARLRATCSIAALQDPDQPQIFVTHSRVARRYRIGRVLLAGDAAHACSPLEGHGMNTGIQDAYHLGWKLALAVSGSAVPTLLDSYEAERRPIAQAVARSGAEAQVRMTQEDPAGRQALIQFLSTPEGPQAAAIGEAEITFAYTQSPIVDQVVPDAPTAASGTQIGFRVGDAGPLEGRNRTCRVHELIGVPEHTLLVMLGEAGRDAVREGLALAGRATQAYRPHVRAYVVTRNVPPDEDVSDQLLRDPTGALHQRLGADQASLCLVRPDGHLGLRAQPPSWERLREHFRRILLTG
jgi:FAD binding domain